MATPLWIQNTMSPSDSPYLELMATEQMKQVRRFHQTFPQYETTPLVSLPHLAERFGVADIKVKDESFRFGLNAFKVLGGSYAIAHYIANRLKKPMSEVTYSFLTSDEFKQNFEPTTFYTATDGNHGRGVAWAANKLGQKSVVRMPWGTTQTRLDAIAAENATVTIEDMNYDDCVRMAYKESQDDPNGVMVQDTAWEGYEDIPSWIMQGYGTIADEIFEELTEPPTHVFAQAGVGSLAGAVVGAFALKYPEAKPKMVVVEAANAECLYLSAKNKHMTNVDGEMKTIMAGLACGEPNSVSWEILKTYTDVFMVVDDETAEAGMRLLGAPLKGDTQVISGESGVAGFAAFLAIMQDDKLSDLKQLLDINEQSRVLFVSTEGDTDPERYDQIVRQGKSIKL